MAGRPWPEPHKPHPAIASTAVAAKGEKEEEDKFAYAWAKCNRSDRMTGMKFFLGGLRSVPEAAAASVEKQNRLAFTTRSQADLCHCKH